MNEKTVGNTEEPLADLNLNDDGEWEVRIWRPIGGIRQPVEIIALHPDDQDVLKWVARNYALYDPSYQTLEERVS